MLLLDLPDQTFADQNRILSRRELPACGCTGRLGEAETASPLDSDVIANKEACIDEICDQRATRLRGEGRTEFSVITGLIASSQ